MSTKRVLTTELALGMYVSKLDRPWLETPFLFQGFPITSGEDIDKLRQYCKYVYVDTTLSEVHPKLLGSTISAGRRRQGNWLSRLLAVPLRMAGVSSLRSYEEEYEPGSPGSFYRDQVSLVKELGTAKDTHTRAQAVIQEMVTGIRTGGRLDLDIVKTCVEPMVDSVLRNNDALAWLARLRCKDDYAYSHSIATSVYTIVLGRHIGYNRRELHQLGLGGLLLDVGKARLPDELLTKSDPLTAEELAEVRRHVDYSVEILEQTPKMDKAVIKMVRSHHERRNGSGYPHKLEGDDIPMFAQIGGLCDAFDAMTSRRPYADTLSAYEAMRKLLAIAGSEFKSELVEQFIQCIGMFPTGSLVELSTGEVGIVISQNKLRRLRPVVMVVLDEKKKPLKKFRRVNLRKESEDEKKEVGLWIRWGLEPGAYGIDPSDYYL
ncbi:MAG: HD-GYP domain-containing protein [Gammaproteobacteria bacterium]|nr:HD-GYP domain-containing protein [Gammaproteobacteria bacterium]